MNKKILVGMVGLFCVVVCGFGGGCARTQPSKFYLLQPLPGLQSQKPALTGSTIVKIGIGPVIVPKYLDRPQIVTTTDEHGVTLAQFDRWAEPLKDNITRVLAENLSALLGTDRIEVFPWGKSSTVTYQVVVEVICFEGRGGESALLKARWSLFTRKGRKELVSKKTTISEPTTASGYEALVSAQSRALAKLSEEIAGTIMETRRQQSADED